MIVSTKLPAGLILEIAHVAGIETPGQRDKRRVSCPFHDDRRPSAFLSASRNLFYCSVCTPDKGWSAKRFAAELGVPWSFDRATPPPPRRHAPARSAPAFTRHDAQRVWDLAKQRAYDERALAYLDEDRVVYDYLRSRGLSEAWENRAFGILGSEMPLPKAIEWWPRAGYRLVVPLFDSAGNLANIQARSVLGDADPKVRFPEGSTASGTVFANRLGREMLRHSGECAAGAVILGEGLTDALALGIVAGVRVLCAPGTGNVHRAVGRWCRERTIYLALDDDDAGHAAVSAAALALHERGAQSVRRLHWPSGARDACEVLELLGTQLVAKFLEDPKELPR